MIQDEWIDNWRHFKNELPHQQEPFSKKNWGHINHSLCSYQGKLKPSIAHLLVETFVPVGGRMFDPFCGVGTIPFEAALNGRYSMGMDISAMAYYISQAKVGLGSLTQAERYITRLESFILNNNVSSEYQEIHGNFGLNKSLKEYYHPDTFKEILLARQFFTNEPPVNPSEMTVLASMLHILHGNRPYALSRKSHPITPYAPSGEFVYKSVIDKLRDKVKKSFSVAIPNDFVPGRIFLQDSTTEWPDEVSDLDAIITSPPFFDSTRFYSANWIRLWFSGWEKQDFISMPPRYVDEIQKKDMRIYDCIFRQAKDRLKDDGVFVLHLGKSKKCDMGTTLLTIASNYFQGRELFSESVAHCNKFGIKDIGTVTDHQYLVLW